MRGINEYNTVTSWKQLLDIHMPPYYDSIYKGVGTIMISYSSLNGVKMHANRHLITDFLKNTLKFKVQNFRFPIKMQRLRLGSSNILSQQASFILPSVSYYRIL